VSHLQMGSVVAHVASPLRCPLTLWAHRQTSSFCSVLAHWPAMCGADHAMLFIPLEFLSPFGRLSDVANHPMQMSVPCGGLAIPSTSADRSLFMSQQVAASRLRPSLRPALGVCRSISRSISRSQARSITHAQASSSQDTQQPINVAEVRLESEVGEGFYFQRALLTATASLTPFLLSAQVTLMLNWVQM
jgi:hypothetical protein